jgi:hypothetical protein
MIQLDYELESGQDGPRRLGEVGAVFHHEGAHLGMIEGEGNLLNGGVGFDAHDYATGEQAGHLRNLPFEARPGQDPQALSAPEAEFAQGHCLLLHFLPHIPPRDGCPRTVNRSPRVRRGVRTVGRRGLQ